MPPDLDTATITPPGQYAPPRQPDRVAPVAGPSATARRKTYRWDFLPENRERALALADRLSIAPAVARVLVNRGFDDAAISGIDLAAFLRPTLGALHDPFLLADMDRATARIALARQRGERVTVFGDYDSDGATSTALMVRVLRLVGVDVDFYIPHRLTEGYGMNAAAIEKLAASGTKLIVTVDNGVGGHTAIARAKVLGIDVIVTDHHQPDDGPLPEACAIVNPNRRDCSYPDKGLAGVGVAFKVAHGLLRVMAVDPAAAKAFLSSVLDLVAIGTISDSAPMLGENRALVHFGLERAGRSTNEGVRALLRLVDPEGSGASVPGHRIGFQIGPRLNAAGRIGSARICVELLVTDDRERASIMAAELDNLNRDRRTIEAGVFEDCMKRLAGQVDLAGDRVVVVCGPDWHLGVVGIVASRLMDIVDRPVIILSDQAGHAKGSARSARGFDMHAALGACREHLLEFGGHPNAAGLQLCSDDVPAFRRAINMHAAKTHGEAAVVRLPALNIDTELAPGELDAGLLRDLARLEPFGQMNCPPLFAARGLRLADTPKVVGTNHLKLQLLSGGKTVAAIGFGLGALAEGLAANPGARLEAAFVPSLNTYWNPPRVEMELKDIRPEKAAPEA